MLALIWTEGIASQGFDQYFYIDSLRRGAGLSENKRKFLFTSESVTEGHPDKIADQVSDAVLDAVLKEDPMGRVACETLVTTGLALATMGLARAFNGLTQLAIGLTKPSNGLAIVTMGLAIASNGLTQLAKGWLEPPHTPKANANVDVIRGGVKAIGTARIAGVV